MTRDPVPETPLLVSPSFHLVSIRIEMKVWALMVATFVLTWVGTGSYGLMVPEEARHVGIAHDMWAARQYIVPRVDGLPVLDGAPLFYWLSVAALAALGPHEWAVRLLSAVCAALTIGVLTGVRGLGLEGSGRRALAALFLLQPGFIIAGRFATPDMLIALLMTLATAGLGRASLALEKGARPETWLMAGWGATGLLGLGAGPLAMLVPLTTVFLWLALRRRFGLMRRLCWWPGPLTLAVVVAPWLILISASEPGFDYRDILVGAFLDLVDHGQHRAGEAGYIPCLIFMSLGCLPLLACLYRLREPARWQAVRTPIGGLMAVWLLVLVVLHPLATMSLVGHASVLLPPLLYFGAIALKPGEGGWRWRDMAPWTLHLVLAVGVTAGGVVFLAQGSSTAAHVARAMAPYYVSAVDKVILLDRFDYEFNFYLGSPKLVFVAADWSRAGEPDAPYWMRELAASAKYAPAVAERLLLTNDELLDKLCERRVVNLWIIGNESAPSRHPILADLTPFAAPGTLRAWYLRTNAQPKRCARAPGGVGQTGPLRSD